LLSARNCMSMSRCWRSRPLDEVAFPYVFLDATYCKARINQRVVSQAVVIATGVAADARRKVLVRLASALRMK
jgi:transposase-like protein